jgi:hypothetical protein
MHIHLYSHHGNTVCQSSSFCFKLWAEVLKLHNPLHTGNSSSVNVASNMVLSPSHSTCDSETLNKLQKIKAEISRFRDSMRWIKFSIYLIFPAALGPGRYSASKRNEYQSRIMFLWSRARPVRRADRFIVICEPVVNTMWDLLSCHNPIGLHGLLRDSFTLWRRSVLPVRYELDCTYCYK